MAPRTWRRRSPTRRLRAQLTPGYRLGCKRVLLSNDFYPALAAPNASLVTEKITEFTADAVVTADGARHPVDTIILATGFHVTDNPMFGKITGRGGRTLAAVFGQTYLGTVVPGFPNYFQLTGANTGLGHSSMIYMIESQLAFIVDAIRRSRPPAAARAWSGPTWPPPTTAAAAQAARHRVGLGLLQLVPRRAGPQPDPLAGLHVRVPAPDPAVPVARFHLAPPG